jgi:uncharacterized membrane protein
MSSSISLYQPVKTEAVPGLLWGSLIGLLFMMPLVGAASGADAVSADP